MEYGALADQQGYSMNDTISRADVLNVRLKDINFKIFFDLTGEGDQDCVCGRSLVLLYGSSLFHMGNRIIESAVSPPCALCSLWR